MSEAPARFTVLAPEEGQSYWQPTPANGYVVVKASHWTIEDMPFSQGIQVVAPGSKVILHRHETETETIWCLEGQGVAEVDGAQYPMVPGTVVAMAPGVVHRFINTGATDLKYIWTICAPGLESFFKRIGRSRLPTDTAPEPFERPADEFGGLE